MGAVSIATDASLGGGGPIVIDGTTAQPATLQATGTFTLSSSRNIFLGTTANGGGGTIDVTSGNTLSYGGVMANNGSTANSLTLVDSGTLLLSGANSYTGATNINGGTLQTGAINTIPLASAVTVASGATLALNGFNQTIASLAGAGSVTNNSAAAATLTVTANFVQSTFSGVISNSTGASTGKLSLTHVGDGTLTLSGVNTYTGATTIISPFGGGLNLDFSSLATPTNIINPSSALVLGGGGLAINDAPGSTATKQTFNGTTITPGKPQQFVR